ncbi:MAG TPA: FGGY family carbohydrate kinase [Jatrophihabitans sp.]|nr:FGGY family carbohydrate kinase [Jatrophihabitans sp.]
MPKLVAGIDSSTQACKVVIRDAETGALVRHGRAPHPDGTEVDPQAWWQALRLAVAEAGGLADVAAVSVAGQQHGMICLDDGGRVVRPALLWNDIRSAQAAAELVAELGPTGWAEAVGSVPVASFTVAKLRWLAEHEPANAARTAAVCLPHDWLSWRLAGALAAQPAGELAAHPAGALADDPGSLPLAELATDRSDASGTGYFDGRTNRYRTDLFVRGLGRPTALPRVLGPAEPAYSIGQLLIGPGAGDNAAAALGVPIGDDLLVSLGTSGVVCARSAVPAADPSGLVAGFADATGAFLPLACTLNAARVLDAAARLLRVGLAELTDLALSAPPGAEGVLVVPYLEGERTPNLPDATGAVHGLTLANATAANLARAAVEGMLCGIAAGMDALVGQGVSPAGIRLVGGAARSEAVRRIAPSILGMPVTVPAPGEYVADGAARQAAWVLAGGPQPPGWAVGGTPLYQADPVPGLRERYAEAAVRYLPRDAG